MEKVNLIGKTIFITGVAGFIGSNLAGRILNEIEDVKVVGLDNMNEYYDIKIKESRLAQLQNHPDFIFIKGNLADKELITKTFENINHQ